MSAMTYLEKMWALAGDGQLEGVLFFAAAYAVLVGTYSLLMQLSILLRWKTTQGRIETLESAKFGAAMRLSEQDYVNNALYHYRVEGVEYEGTRLSPWVMSASHNAKVFLELQRKGITWVSEGMAEVYYNPKSPKKSFLIKPSLIGLAITAFAAYGLAWYFVVRF